MADKVELVKDHLKEARLMQLATISDGKPWVCTVYFVFDDELNFYWLSLPTRRHSKEIDDEPSSAITVAVKQQQPVVGIQAQGRTEAVYDTEVIASIMPSYVDKYSNGKDFLDNFLAGESQHVLFKFTPTEMVLFDEVNFADDPRQSIDLE